MKIVITESQFTKLSNEKLIFFRRRYDDMIDHLKEIIYEGLWHYDGCDYKDFKEFYDMIVESSVETFIYSYEQLGGYEDNSMQEFLEKFVRDKFGNYIKNKWRERECE